MGNSNPGRWNLAEVLDAIDAVGRFYGLAGWRFGQWRDAAWTVFLRRADQLFTRFRGEASPRTYLGAVFAHECLTWMKRQLPRLKDGARGVDDLAGSCVPTSEFVDPIRAREEAEADRQTRRTFRSTWQQLSDADRKLLVAYWVDGRRMPAIAASMGCSPEAAHKRAQRALAKLRALMQITRPPARPPRRRRG